MESVSDTKILEGLRSGKKGSRDRALRRLYAQNYSVIAEHIKKNSGTEDDAADVFQDAVIIFYKKIVDEDLELSCAVQTYLYAVAKRVWLGHLKQVRKAPVATVEPEQVAIDEGSLRLLVKTERKEALSQVVEELGTGCREILRLFYFDRMRMREIALRMGLQNEQVAKNKKADCLKKLRGKVDKSERLKVLLR